MSSRLVALIVASSASALALAAAHGCGPPCADDRCSLSPTAPQTTRVDYTKKSGSGSGSSSTTVATAGSGSAAPAAGSGSAAPVVVAAGSGSAKPATGSAAPVATAGSGSAVPQPVKPPDPVPMSAAWELWTGNQFKMYVISKGSVAANTKINFEFVKTPTKTPFVVVLEVGAGSSEGVWNDCPENKIVCAPSGTKTHVTKKAGQVLIQAGINWAVTGVADESKGTLVTWTNNLSREVFSLRLLK